MTNTKGGCGKTTIATNLAAAFSVSGFQTALADVDIQQSSVNWTVSRPANAAAVTGLDWSSKMHEPPKKTQRLIIDAPGALAQTRIKELVKQADIVITPVLPSVFDEQTTRQFIKHLQKIKSVRKSKRALGIVGNRIRRRTMTAGRLDEFLAELGLQSVTRLRDTQIYPTLAAKGLSLFDIHNQRVDNFKHDWRPLLAFIDDRTRQRGE